MNTNSVLLAYATRFGSTQEVAETVAASLREAGLKVDLRLMRQVESLDQYEVVVLGAALYNAKWHADAHQFLAQHQEALRQRPVAIFTLGPLSNSAAAMRNSRRQLDRELVKYPWPGNVRQLRNEVMRLAACARGTFGGRYYRA